MKSYGILCIIVAIILLVAPLAAIKTGYSEPEDVSEAFSQEDGEYKKTLSDEKNDSDTISVFMTSTQKTEKMSIRDYIIGAVSAEMPASYSDEALKAQALAAVTFAEYLKRNGSDENINGADISNDSSVHQGYMSPDEMKEKWGDTYEKYSQKVADAVDEVIDKVITYDGEPIMAAYHAISAGQTESAENIWGKDIPYLRSVESEGDKYSSRYSSQAVFTCDEIKNAAKSYAGDSYKEYDGDEEDMIIINSVSPVGTVLSVTVCGQKMTGMELRNLLSLKSPTFDVTYDDGSFVFDVRGYGHGVGMSQYGADCYAEQGMTYEEIIAHYYPGTKIEDR